CPSQQGDPWKASRTLLDPGASGEIVSAPDDPVPAMSEPDAPRQSPSPRWESVGFWLYTLHLLTVFGLALSNVFLGLALLLAPRTARWRGALAARQGAVL